MGSLRNCHQLLKTKGESKHDPPDREAENRPVHDEMDCGATCLRMIARFHGRYYSLEYLRELTFVNRQGVSLMAIGGAYLTLVVTNTYYHPTPFIGIVSLRGFIAIIIVTIHLVERLNVPFFDL